MKLRVSYTWDGTPLPEQEAAEIECFIENGELTVLVDAPFFGDPAPPQPAGSTDELWTYEVAELFLLGSQDRYLEIELGPHGHYLVLQLHGRRNTVRKGLPLRYEAEILSKRWRGVAVVPLTYLPPNINRGNAYAIHGLGAQRTYSAAFPVAGPTPDFHRLEAFGQLEWPPSVRTTAQPRDEKNQ